MPRRRKPASPFRCFNSSPEVSLLAVLMNVKYPLWGIVRPNAPLVKPAGVEAVPFLAPANPHRHSATSTALRK